MWKKHLHWWILSGIVAGALIGSFVYSHNVDEARLTTATATWLADHPDVKEEDLTGAQKEEIANLAKDEKFLKDKAGEINLALANQLKPTFFYSGLDGIARIFLDLLKMIVIPLVFFTLVAGMMGLGDLKRLGRIGIKTAAWYVMTSLIAIVTGLLLVNIIGPGHGTKIHIPDMTKKAPVPESVWDVIVKMIPENIVDAMANFNMFGLIFFSLLFGVFLVQVAEEKKKSMVGFIEGGTAVMMKMTQFIIALAPIGIMGLVARMVSVSGPQVFLNLIGYVITVFAALGIHAFVTLPLLFWAFTKKNPFRFMNAMSPALMTGFSTASSSGTLAITMERSQNGAGVSNRISSFVLPLGATINMDGTALYECVTVLFIAQVHAGIDPNFSVTIGQQIMIVFLALMVSIGAAGIPHAGLVMMVIILKAVNLPIEYTAIIWSVDRLLDMCRTCVNIWSDSNGTFVIAATEKEVDEAVLYGSSPPKTP